MTLAPAGSPEGSKNRQAQDAWATSRIRLRSTVVRPFCSNPGVGPAALLAMAVSACSSSPDAPGAAPGAQRSEIALESRGLIFELATALTEQRSLRARVYEEASRATGTLFAPLLDADGAPLEGPGGVSIRSTCGVTFVSETDAITAAHCVASDNDLDALTVEMYRPTRALESGFLEGATLSGSFPDFEHTPLGPEQGYFVDRYPCRVVSRCSEDFGGPIDCDASLAEAGDTALIRCEGRPGARYGFVNVARYDDPNADVLVPWKHEVYAVRRDLESGYVDHYELATPEFADNYHYFGSDSDGVEQHQLLPLIAPDFPDGTPHSKLADVPDATDVFGCHGTSGSGVLQPGRGALELLAPAVGGNAELGTYLCNHAPSFDGESREPGAQGIGYVPLGGTRGLVEAEALECDPFSGTSFSVFTHFECVRRSLTLRGGAFAAGFEAPTSPSALDRTEQPVFMLDSDSTASLGEFSVRRDTPYRVEINAWTSDACSGTDCPSLGILAGGKSLVTQRLEGEPRVASVAASFSVSGERLEFGVRARRGPFELSAFTLREETRVVDFEDAGERLAMLLHDPSLGEGYMPMRFVGDGKDGFEALLLPGERLVATRQALAAGRRWFVKFTRPTGNGPLRCGLLDTAGASVVEADCSSGAVVLDDRDGDDARLAVFVDSAGSDEPSALDDWLVVSDAAPDADDDGVPDFVDVCPNDPPDQLTETVAHSVCRPEPGSIRLSAPEPPCSGLELSAALELVNGRAPAAQPISIDPALAEIELPLGVHRVRWVFRDALGNEQRIVNQNVRVIFEPGGACCPAGLELESPSSPFVEPSEAARCAALGEQGDFLSVASGESFVSGGIGGDYLFSSGAAAVLSGGGGDDYLGASSGTVALYGGEGADTLHALGTNSARLVGGNGADTLVGGAGPDELIPGAGALLAAAGAGDDVIRIYDACELTPELLIAGGPGRDTVIAPIARKDFERQGGRALDVEQWVVDDTKRYLSGCFSGP